MGIKNKLLLGLAAGLAGGSASYMVELGAKKLRLGTPPMIDEMTKGKDEGLSALGAASQTLKALIGALPLVYIHAATGRANAAAKGLAYGGAAWLVTSGLRRKAKAMGNHPSVSISALAAKLAFGAVSSMVISALGDDAVFRTGREIEVDKSLFDQEYAEWADDNKLPEETFLH